jgi:UrcA family protein
MAMKNLIKTQLNSTASMLSAVLFALICAASGGGALAAEPSQPLTKIVHYGDLNLDSEQGAKVLYARMRSAARDVCSPLEGRDLTGRRLWQTCFDNAVANAVGQVDKTMVSALHIQTTNRSKS